MQLLRGERRVVRVGHRGAAALAPENTLPSLARAAELGVDLVEFDVLPGAGGALVLAHDVRPRVPDGPSLDDALELLAGLDVGIHLDLKGVGEEARVVDALRLRGLVPRTLVTSVSLHSLRRLRGLEPELRRGVSYPDDRFGISRARAAEPLIRAGARGLGRALPYRIGRWLGSTGAVVASLHQLLISRMLVERCHARGVAVFAWTVNDLPTARSLVSAGLDGIITDDPRIFEGLER